MSGAAPDLIAGYLEELYAGLRVPAAEAELIAAEAEDHLRETAAAGIAIGMTELEAQQAAISSFGPVRAVVRAHRRRTVTAGGAAMAAWKLAALLATTVGAGGLAGMGIFTYLLRSAPDGPGPVPTVQVVYAAMAAGGLVLLATRRLTGHGTPGRDPLSPGVTASCFLVASALLGIFGFLLRSGPAAPPGPTGPCSFVCNVSSGPAPASGPGPGAGPVLMVLVVYAAMAAGGLVLLAARRLTGHRTTGRDRLSPGATASCFLLASAPLVALIVRPERHGDAHRSGHLRVLDDPALGWLRLGRSPGIGRRRRRVPGGGRRLRSPGGAQAGPARARIRCALPRPGSG